MQLSYFLNEMSFFLNAHLRKLFSYLVICKLPFKVDHYCPLILHYLQNYSPIFECSLCFPLPVYFGFFSGLWSITLFPSKRTNLITKQHMCKFIHLLSKFLSFFWSPTITSFKWRARQHALSWSSISIWWTVNA
jgi:hypothetical protein